MIQPDNHPPHELPSSSAIESLFKRLFPLAQHLARQAIGTQRFRYLDEDDIAVSACAKLFRELFRGSAEGLAGHNISEDEQRRLLAVIVRQKIIDLLRRTKAVKRGGGLVRGDSAFEKMSEFSPMSGIDGVADHQPHGILAAMEQQEQDLLLNDLPSDDLRKIALFKLEGYSDVEIAAKLDVCVRTVERKLSMIRKRWAKKVR